MRGREPPDLRPSDDKFEARVRVAIEIIDQATDSPTPEINEAITFLLSKRPLAILETPFGRDAAWIRDNFRSKDGAPRVYPVANGLPLVDVLEAAEYLKSIGRSTRGERLARNAALNGLVPGTKRRRTGARVHRLVPRSDP